MKRERSQAYFAKAKDVIPGGVNSPVRACRSVGCDPLFIARASGSKIYDVDGNVFIDCVGSWGPMILGHAHPEVTAALRKALENGTSFGAPTPLEVELAELLIEAVPSLEMVRLTSSGTEATMSAIRLARAYTGRKKIIKCDGCYHGHGDAFLVKAGSGVATLGIPGSPGVPEEIAGHTISIPYNDADALAKVLEKEGGQVACFIIEPVPGNMGVVLPREGYLRTVRELTEKHGVLLIFDEVISGFRMSLGGAQSCYGIFPDLTCLGKIIGGGLPVGAYGGRKDIMLRIAPEGDVYQAGTLSGNPLAVTAGIATLKILSQKGVYEDLEGKGAYLEKTIDGLIQRYSIPARVNRAGSLMTIFFTKDDVVDFKSALTSDTNCFAGFYRGMLEKGVYLPPSQFEAIFISLAHTKEDIDRILDAAEKYFKVL
ncbi:MAG: glutamate-1-semialdehyde 2,1-aminomutase [Thermodesulfobacteriota bacterium]|nr:glutamate-1-semialdehyde 2,1-aminomutase [Thermodesulfobacteriota bacterium]